MVQFTLPNFFVFFIIWTSFALHPVSIITTIIAVRHSARITLNEGRKVRKNFSYVSRLFSIPIHFNVCKLNFASCIARFFKFLRLVNRSRRLKDIHCISSYTKSIEEKTPIQPSIDGTIRVFTLP